MRFCPPHWEKTKAAVKAQGLMDLASTSGEEVIGKMKGWARDGYTLGNFEPLMLAHWLIVQNAVQVLGSDILFIDGCPMCEVGKHCEKGKTSIETWPEEAAKDVKTQYEELMAKGAC